MLNSAPRIVVLGGGNGTSRLLAALLPLLKARQIASLHALVHMSDDGGSTGRLRTQYGVAACGDLTKCLLALSGLTTEERGQVFLKALNFRYHSGDFEGHTLRNMLLTSLQISSDLDSALASMAQLLRVPKMAGVLPTTLTTLTERVDIETEGVRRLLGEGEHFIAHHVNLQAEPSWLPGHVGVSFNEGDVPLNPRAQKVLEEASHIIVAPGHTYGSILPSLALPALGRAVATTKADLWVVMTLLTTPRQTTDWSGEDFVRVYESYLQRKISTVIANTTALPIALNEGQGWVSFKEHNHPYQLIRHDMVSSELPPQQDGDRVPRAIVVHDSQKLHSLFEGILT